MDRLTRISRIRQRAKASNYRRPIEIT